MTMQTNVTDKKRQFPKDPRWQSIVDSYAQEWHDAGELVQWELYWPTISDKAFADYDRAQAPRATRRPYSRPLFICLIGILCFLQVVDVLSNLKGADVFNRDLVIGFLWTTVLIVCTFCEQLGRVLNVWYGHFMDEYELIRNQALSHERRDYWMTQKVYWLGFIAVAVMYIANGYYSYWFFSDKGSDPLMGFLFSIIINAGEWIVGRQITREWKKRKSV